MADITKIGESAGKAGLEVVGPFVLGQISTTSGPGDIPVTSGTHRIVTTGTGDALTLIDGSEGQMLTLIYTNEGAGSDTAVLTPANFLGGTTITFNATGDAAILQFLSGNWNFLSGTAVVA